MGWVASFFSGLKAEVEWLITSLAVATGSNDATADTQSADAASTAHDDNGTTGKGITIPTIADQQADNAMTDHHQIAPDSDTQSIGNDPHLVDTATHIPANLLLNADFLIDTTDHSGPAPSPGLAPISLGSGGADLSSISAIVGPDAVHSDENSQVSLPDPHFAVSRPDAGEFALASLGTQAYGLAQGTSSSGTTANGGGYSHHDITSQGGTSTLVLHLDNSLYDLSRTNPSLYKSISGDLQTVVNFFASHFNNSATDSANSWQMNVGWGEVSGSALPSGALGASNDFLYAASYSQLQTGFNAVSQAESGFGSQPVNIPGSEPFSGSNPTFMLTAAEIHALGVPITGLHFGGIGFSSAPGPGTTGTYGSEFFFNPSAPIAGAYDFMGIAIHEITEELGRVTLNGGSGTSPQLTPLDLFHFADTGGATYSGATPGYFSVDNGTTNLMEFNNNSANGDFGDWATTADAFAAAPAAATGSPAPAGDLPFTYADYLTMEAVGFAGTFKFDGSVNQTSIDWSNQLGGTL